jgi:acyl-coenzyme A thioesterase PaaI-like protein
MVDPAERMFRGFHEREHDKTDVDLARDDFADAVREFHELAVRGAAEVGHLRDAAGKIRAIAAQLDDKVPTESYGSLAGMSDHVSGTVGRTSFLDRSPISGSMNPLAAPMKMSIQMPDPQNGVEGTVTGRVTFGLAYEGPPGCVHGGFVAAAFDEVLGQVQAMTGEPGMTGELVVRYKSPTPLHTELVFTARVVKVEGRKIHTHATLTAGERLCAESEGLFISMNKEVFARLLRIRSGESSNDGQQL